MLVAENNVSYAAGRLARGALLQGMESGDVPTVTAAANYSAYMTGQITQASSAMSSGTGVVNNYNITVEAKNLKELDDIVRMVEYERVEDRMGYTGG